MPFYWKVLCLLALPMGRRLLGGWVQLALVILYNCLFPLLREREARGELTGVKSPPVLITMGRASFRQPPATLGGRKRHIPVRAESREHTRSRQEDLGSRPQLLYFKTVLSALIHVACSYMLSFFRVGTLAWVKIENSTGCCYKNIPGPSWAGIESSEESLLSLCSNRKGLEDFMCEDLNAYGQLDVCKYPQAKSWAIISPCNRVWPEGLRWETSGEVLCSAQLNQIVYAYILSGEDNWGLTGCQLSSWTMLDICYHDGKQASLQGFEGQMTECI